MDLFSFELIFFVAVVTCVVFVLPRRMKAGWLLITSMVFYWIQAAEYMVVLLGLVVGSYSIGNLISISTRQRSRRLWTVFGIIMITTLLASFKFAGQNQQFFPWVSTMNRRGAAALVIPIGLSFYSLQAVSYLVDIYRKKISTEKSAVGIGLYLSFFPKIPAGPIESPNKFVAQVGKLGSYEYERVVGGMLLFCWGLSKKIMADRVGINLIDPVFIYFDLFRGSSLLVVMFGFYFQLFMDFSGLIDMAQGISQILGIELTCNFNQPWLAISIKDFWQRWHISLGRWLKEYVYIPLGGNRVGKFRWVINIMIVFVLSGLWHGVDVKYVVWGLIHAGVYLVQEFQWFGRKLFIFLWQKIADPWRRIISTATIFTIVSVSWIFFRSDDIFQARMMFLNLFKQSQAGAFTLVSSIWMTLGLILITIVTENLLSKRSLRSWVLLLPKSVRWFVYGGWVLWIINSGVVEKIPFIYQQF